MIRRWLFALRHPWKARYYRDLVRRARKAVAEEDARW